MSEFAIHTSLSIADMAKIREYLHQHISNNISIDEIKEIISLVEKLDALLTEFNKEGEKF